MVQLSLSQALRVLLFLLVLTFLSQYLYTYSVFSGGGGGGGGASSALLNKANKKVNTSKDLLHHTILVELCTIVVPPC